MVRLSIASPPPEHQLNISSGVIDAATAVNTSTTVLDSYNNNHNTSTHSISPSAATPSANPKNCNNNNDDVASLPTSSSSPPISTTITETAVETADDCISTVPMSIAITHQPVVPQLNAINVATLPTATVVPTPATLAQIPAGAQIIQNPPPCAMHHPQQHQQIAAMHHQAHLAAQHHHQQQQQQQQQQQHHSTQQPTPLHAHHQQQIHHMPPPVPQHHQHHHHSVQQHGHENGHSGVGNNGSINNMNGGGGSVNGGSVGSNSGSPLNGPNANSGGGGGTSSGGNIYLPYPGEFYPPDHGYYIQQHHHEMCPSHHPAMCSMPTEYGPTTVQMVSQNRPPPVPVPVQVPQGQVMQQYVNENGTLTHVVLSQYPNLHAGQGPHMHAPYITTNGSTSHYYGPLATGYGGPGGYHPLPGGPMQPQQISHSPSPPSIYHKDERARSQYKKLVTKLDKQRELGSAKSTPAHSPRKSELNGVRRTSRNGASSVGTSEDGEESSSVPDDEDDCQNIIDQLSAVQKPEVTEVTSRSAMLRWEALPPNPDCIINNRDLRYEVLLSDRGKEGKYKIIFKGESYSCMIQDLKPGQEYFVCLQVHYEKIQGSASEPTVFIAPPCEPDQPSPPDLNSRTKNTLQLRWRQPCENGSVIKQYILEYDEGQGKEFIEVIRTKNKHYSLGKLQPSTRYSFRLLALNECGSSLYSDIVQFTTCVNPPTVPKPPQLLTNNSNSMHLGWERRTQDEKFTLQMAERECGHGFLNMYNGPDASYECINLKRATVYQFRLRATNESGFSAWSSEVTYKTNPERPGRPAKPIIKGKIHGNYFKAKWDPPTDRGGAEIRKYFLEISSGAKFERIYTGVEPETICDRLSPGTTYQIRASCEGPSGLSAYSDVCTVTTEAIAPGAPEPPHCDGAPGPFAAVLRWDSPDYNGGAPVLEYEVKLTGLPNYSDEIIYHGKEMYCICKELLPGEKYQAHVRAVNRIGAGSWSDMLLFKAGAAPPNPPSQLEILVRSATHLTVEWKEPQLNGSPISEYRLESSLTNESSNNYTICYQGIKTSADIRDLVPYTLYYFRVNAENIAGISPYSEVLSQQTPAAVPGVPQIVKSEITASELTLNWVEPESNGSKILYYRIEYSDRSPLSTELSTKENVNEFTITKLASETTYKFKIQAVNEVGAGQWSAPSKLTTLPPPPAPPHLECAGSGHNFIRLKWGEGKNTDFTKYYVEMYNSRAKDFQEVHKGTSLKYTVHKLLEQTEYVFRICAETDRAGTGDWSPEYRFKTTITPPSSIKPPRIALDENCVNPSTTGLGGLSGKPSGNLSNSNCGGSHATVLGTSSTIEWQQSKNSFSGLVEYILQYSNIKETDFKQLYRGIDTKFTIENLDPGSSYLLRVCPVRVTRNGDIFGPFTPSIRFQMPLIKSSQLTSSFSAISTDRHVDGGTHAGLVSSLNSNLNGMESHKSNLNVTLLNSGGVNQQSQLHSSFDSKENNTKMGLFGGVGGAVGALRRVQDKINALYSSRKRFTDQQKAVFWMVTFLLLAFIFAALLSMFMR